MKTITRFSIFLIIVTITYSCLTNKKLAEPRTVILPLSDTVTLRERSVVYALPRTVFTVFVEMERTIEKPGPYARFADDLLGLTNAVQNEIEFWSVQGITVKTHEELDPSEFYVIESNSLFQTTVLTLKKEGLILDLNAGIFNPVESQTGARESEINQVRSFDLGSDEYFQVQSDTAYKRLNVDSSFIRIPYIVEKKKKYSIDQLAEKAAKRLLEMRDGKHLILTGEANVFPQSDAAINEMNRLEKEYTELFTGKILKETRTFSYQITPDKDMIGKPVVLFQFSELTGPSVGTGKGGTPFKVEFIPEQKTRSLTILNKKQTELKAPKFDKLYYRVPDVVNMKISLGPEVLFNSRRLVYQFGEVIQLPANYVIIH
jgi:hypothetical protein